MTQTKVELIDAKNSVTISGSTPSLTIGDAGAEDTKIVFDGNAQDFYIGLDDSTDDLVFGKGSALGTTQAIAIDENMDVAIGPTSNVTITNDGNEDTLTLISTDADASGGPVLDFYRNSSSPADSDTLGKIVFRGRNDNSQDVDYANIDVTVSDVSDGAESNAVFFRTMLSGTLTEMIKLQHIGSAGSVTGEVAINDGSGDINFRVESNGNANMIKVDAGNDVVGIGASPDLGIGLHIKESDSGSGSVDAHANQLVIEHGTSGEGCGISFLAATDGFVRLAFGDSGDDNIGQIVYNNTGNSLQFHANAAERGRFSDNGHFFIAQTSTNTPGYGNNTIGHCLKSNGASHSSANGVPSGFNRTDDGDVLAFSSAGGTEGFVNISGSTVSYGAFTGSHWSRLADNSKPTILRGTIMESIDEMCDWYIAESGEIKAPIALPSGKSVGDAVTFTVEDVEYTGVYKKEDDIKHVKCKISDTADSKKVYGVFSNWDDADDGLDGDVNDLNIAQVGTFIIRVNKDVTVSAGDLLVSNGDGTAKKQDDDIIRSKTVAKVNSNVKVETYSDGSYTVPCTLHC